MKTLLTGRPDNQLENFFAGSDRLYRPGSGSPAIEVKKNESEYRVVAHVPGVKKEDLNVEIKDGYLILSGKSEKKESGEFEAVYSELVARSEFHRALKIDEARFDREAMSARLEQGVLEIVLPIRAEERSRQIKVQ